jgi:hypothetical protein
LYRRSLPRRGAGIDHSEMQELARLVDADSASLEARVRRMLARGEGECLVLRYTYWYTARPPVHEAVVVRRLPSD